MLTSSDNEEGDVETLLVKKGIDSSKGNVRRDEMNIEDLLGNERDGCLAIRYYHHLPWEQPNLSSHYRSTPLRSTPISYRRVPTPTHYRLVYVCARRRPWPRPISGEVAWVRWRAIAKPSDRARQRALPGHGGTRRG